MPSLTIRIDDELDARIEGALLDVTTGSMFSSTNKSTMVRALIKLGLDALDCESPKKKRAKARGKKLTSDVYQAPTAPTTKDEQGLTVWSPGDPV